MLKSRRIPVPAALFPLLALALASCQDGYSLGVTNRCDRPIEVIGSEGVETPDSSFTRVSAGETRYVVTLSESWRRAVVWARRAGDQDWGVRSEFDPGEVVSGGSDEPELLVAIDGSRCP